MMKLSNLRFHGRGKRSSTRVLLMAALSFALVGCSLPGSGPAPDIYTLSPKSTFPDDLPTVGWQLVVEEPFAARGLDSTFIALRPSDVEIKYFKGTRWSDRAPRMVQDLLVESFENSGKIVAVGRKAIGLRSDYTLKSELREFQAEYFHGSGAPKVVVRLNLKLVKQAGRTIIASKTISQSVQAEGGTITDVVTAFDEALGKVLRRTVAWTLTEVK